MIAVIDNYDSFTYNLVQYLGELGAEIRIWRNDAISVEKLQAAKPSHIVISPGPGTPQADSGISLEIIRTFYQHTPILGVCLGHQAIAYAFGGQVVPAQRLMHGKTSPVYHTGQSIFRGIPTPFVAARYHSLIVAEPLPPELELLAFTAEGEVMALRHREYTMLIGVQFHPESIMTPEGKGILAHFMAIQSR